MKKSTVLTLSGIVLCLAVIAGLFVIVHRRSAQDAEYAAEQSVVIVQHSSDDETDDDSDTAQIDMTATNSAAQIDMTATNSSAQDEEAETDETEADDTEEAEADDAAQTGLHIEWSEDENAVPLDDSAAFYQKLDAGEPVNILFTGDSISAGDGASGDDAAWTKLFTNELTDAFGSECSVTNLSVSGTCASDGCDAVAALDGDTQYDLVVICFGQNDEEDDLPLYYEVLLREIGARWPECAVISILESSQREVTTKIQTIIDLAEHYNAMTVDTVTPFADDYDALCDDGIHPNDAGQLVYAQAVLDALSLRQTAVNADADAVSGRAADLADFM